MVHRHDFGSGTEPRARRKCGESQHLSSLVSAEPQHPTREEGTSNAPSPRTGVQILQDGECYLALREQRFFAATRTASRISAARTNAVFLEYVIVQLQLPVHVQGNVLRHDLGQVLSLLDT
jgi:hypothetical protein